MATTNTYESRARDNKFDLKSRKDYLPRDNNRPRDNGNRTKDNNFDKFKSREFKNNDKGTYSYVKNKEFRRSSFTDKDEEPDNKALRSRKAQDSRPKTQKEQQSEKLETLKRLEREKKVLQKKLRDEESEKPKHPAVKLKRSSKNDWTKDYEYGLIDEDDDYKAY